MKKMIFDPQDHFKGTYHKDDQDDPDFYPFKQDPFFNIGQLGQVYHPIFGWIDHDLADKIDSTYPSIDKFTSSLNDSCEHEPIDVGFNQPKMVCKKCDKDL